MFKEHTTGPYSEVLQLETKTDVFPIWLCVAVPSCHMLLILSYT